MQPEPQVPEPIHQVGLPHGASVRRPDPFRYAFRQTRLDVHSHDVRIGLGRVGDAQFVKCVEDLNALVS